VIHTESWYHHCHHNKADHTMDICNHLFSLLFVLFSVVTLDTWPLGSSFSLLFFLFCSPVSLFPSALFSCSTFFWFATFGPPFVFIPFTMFFQKMLLSQSICTNYPSFSLVILLYAEAVEALLHYFITNYRRSGFDCELLLIANCEFS